MPLVATDDSANITEDAAPNTTSGDVTTNDAGGAGALTITAVNGSASNVAKTITGTFGTIKINANGTYTYTLNNADLDTQALRAGQTGIDSFTYTVFDGTSSSTATIRVNVAGFNDAPHAGNDTKSIRADLVDVVATGQVLTNDSDPETGFTLTAVNGSAGNIGTTVTGTYGTLTLNADGTYTYTLDADDPDTQAVQYYQTVNEVFTYTITDADGASDTANITITIAGADRPVAFELTGETVVNTTTAGTQASSATASLASGGYVIAWLDSGTAGNAEVRGQLYNANGAKVGTEFLVNSADAVNELAPQIVSLKGGGFVVTWALEGGGVEAQLFNDAGAKLGAKIVVASGAGEMTPDVSALSTGGFVINWQGQVSGHAEVKAQMFDAAGATVGSQILVPSAPAIVSQVAGLAGGGFVVVLKTGLAQLYDTGGTKVGGQFRVFTDENSQYHAGNTLNAIASLAGGGFVVTYTWGAAAAQFYDPSNISGQIFDANGAKVGGEFTIPDSPTNSQSPEYDSSIIALSDGRFIVTWNGYKAIIVDAQGNLIGHEFVVPDDHTTDSIMTGVALASGNVAFAWTSQTDIKTQLFGVLDGGPVQFGTANADTIHADTGNTGQFLGLAGNDTYFVDQQSDKVIERVGEGYDTVYSSVSYALAAGSEVEVLSASSWGATTALALTGNGFANTLYGNAGANVLDGGGGADVLNGMGGDDLYFLDNAGDAVVEGAGGGFDTVFTGVSYTLGAGVAAEILSVVDWSATTPIALTGNELANRLYGNAGANVLTGAAGDDWLTGFGGGDTLVGGQGADTYWIWAGNDAITETAGNGYDTVYAFTSYVLGADANVEVVSTYSWIQGEAIDLTGNALSNVLFGNVGANVLNGGLGSDRMTGFAGADTFAFTTALGADNVDTVVDFVAGTDKIAMDDAIFTQAGGLGALSANAFVTGSAAGDADDRIIYNSATGALLYDADGSGAGAAVQFATLSTGLSLSASDFMVI